MTFRNAESLPTHGIESGCKPMSVLELSELMSFLTNGAAPLQPITPE